jgi:ferredoxin-NADP reductase
VLDVPADLRDLFAYEAGQFCTFRVTVGGEPRIRCYSMSSSPAVDAELAVTVKRVPGGVVSNWMIDSLAPGDVVDVAAPAGFFRLGPGDGDVVAFAGGSGITPVFSLLKTGLVTTSRRFRLLYANRDHDSIIFRAALDALAEEHGDRLAVAHHLDVGNGFVGPHDVRRFVEEVGDAEYYVCGPTPFMDIVEDALAADGVGAGRIHIERFTPPPPDHVEPVAEPADGSRVTVELAGRTDSTDHRPGTTILQAARQMGMSPPFSCESGSCATCMARLVEGAATMHLNNALTDDEVEEGWVLTCQAVPTTPTVHVVYE